MTLVVLVVLVAGGGRCRRCCTSIPSLCGMRSSKDAQSARILGFGTVVPQFESDPATHARSALCESNFRTRTAGSLEVG
eukprot:COSAG01_NODE_52733_length_344_cov_1.510204_1_plen_78_part_01